MTEAKMEMILGDPQISYDEMTRVVTIDGYKFSREVFSFITTTPPGIRIRIIERKDGVVTISQERDPLEAAAPAMLAALKVAQPLLGNAPFLRPDAGETDLKLFAEAVRRWSKETSIAVARIDDALALAEQSIGEGR